MLLSLVANVGFLIFAGFIAFQVISGFGSGKAQFSFWGAAGAVTLAMLACLAIAWLVRWPGVWIEIGRLLSDAEPKPMRMRVWVKGSGKGATTQAEFRSVKGPRMVKEIDLGGVLPPCWLRNHCARKPVLVYGFEDGEPPFLIEEPSGRLAFVAP